MSGTDSEFARLARAGRRKLFGTHDINLPAPKTREETRQKSQQAIESLKKFSAPAKALAERVGKKK